LLGRPEQGVSVKIRPTLLASAVVLAALPAAASATVRPVPQIEQINRASGLLGPSPIVEQWGNDGENSAVSEDGRIAVFAYASGQEPFVPTSTILPDALYARDLLLGKTYAISDSRASYTSMDPSGTLVAFTTDEAIDAADTNGATDVYVWNRLTQRRSLVSRADGLRGEALGIEGSGGLVGDGTTVVFSSGGSVWRRGLLTGRTVRVGSGGFASVPQLGGTNHLEDFASADGRVISTTEGIVTPWGVQPLGVVLADGNPRFANWLTPRISPSGRVAVIQDAGESDEFGRLDGLVRIDTRTGARHVVPLDPALADFRGSLLRLSPDERSVIVNVGELNSATGLAEPWAIDLRTGKGTPIEAPVGNYSRNLRFAVAASSVRYDVFTPRGLFVSGIDGARLPGTVEVPGPSAWVSVARACRTSPTPAADSVGAIILASFEFGPLPASAVRVRAWSEAGVLVQDATITPSSPDYPGQIAPGVGIPVGESAARVEVTVRLSDGRISRDTQTIPGRDPGCTSGYIPGAE
jgi:hypothetical protein